MGNFLAYYTTRANGHPDDHLVVTLELVFRQHERHKTSTSDKENTTKRWERMENL